MRKLAKEDDSGEDFTVPEKDPKVDKENISYIEYGPFRCGECNMYYHDENGGGRCTLVEGDISGADGSCYFWAPRNTQPIQGKKYEPMLSQEAAGYVEYPNGTSCSSCKFYKPDTRECEMVLGDIDALGCCNGWTPHEEATESIKTEKQWNKIFKIYGIKDLS